MRKHGHREKRTIAELEAELLGTRAGIGARNGDVTDVNHLAPQHCASSHRLGTGSSWIRPGNDLDRFGGYIMVGEDAELTSVVAKRHAQEPIAQLHGARDDRVEDRLNVDLRATDDTQDLACGRLLLKGLAHLSMSL